MSSRSPAALKQEFDVYTTSDTIGWLSKRPEFGSQWLQRRCFVASSYKQKAAVLQCVSALRELGVVVWSFCSYEFSFDEGTWDGMTLRDALDKSEVKEAAMADKTFLETLSPADFLLVLLPSGFSTGWEVGFASARGAHVVVAGENANPDIPLANARAFVRTWQEAVAYIAERIGRRSDAEGSG
jgi:hypothetical protein